MDAQLKAIYRRWTELTSDEDKLETDLWWAATSATQNALRGALETNSSRVAKMVNEEAIRRAAEWYEKLWDARDALLGLVVLGLSVALLIGCRPEQRGLLSVLIILCCAVVWLTHYLPIRFLGVEVHGQQALSHMRKFLGSKDLARGETQEAEWAEYLRRREMRSMILRYFLLATCLLALGGVMVALLP
jgi:hypothetical protein